MVSIWVIIFIFIAMSKSVFHIIAGRVWPNSSEKEKERLFELLGVIVVVQLVTAFFFIYDILENRELPRLLYNTAMVLAVFLSLTCLLKNKINCVLNTLFLLPVFLYIYYMGGFFDHSPPSETINNSLLMLTGGMLFLICFSESNSKIILYSVIALFTLGLHLMKANLLQNTLSFQGSFAGHPLTLYILVFTGAMIIRHKFKKHLSTLEESIQATNQGISKVMQGSKNPVVRIRAERDEEGNILNLWIEKVNIAFESVFKKSLHEVKNQEANYIFDLVFANDHFDLHKILFAENKKYREFHSKKWESWFRLHILRPGYSKFFLIFEDITKAKKKTTELEISRKRYKVLLEAIPDMFFVIGKDGTYEDFVIKESDLFKIEDVNIVGSTIYDVGFPKNMAEKIYACIQSCLRNNTIETIEYSLDTPNGTYLFEMRLAKLNARSVISVARDITRRKNAEFRLEKAKKRAEESDRLKSAFLANLSHEIRTPLNIITHFTRMLIDGEMDYSEKTELSDAISQNGTQLLNMIDNTIHLSRIETDSVHVEPHFCKINNLLRDIYNRHKPLIPDSRPVKLIINLDVPNPAFGFDTDSRLLTETLAILVDNALKYTKNGEINMGYEMLLNEEVKFTVSDTGIGIPKEETGHIFSRFYRIKNEINEMTSGSGLGLPIAQHYIQLLGGKLHLETSPGKGSTFWFSLPFKNGQGYLRVVS